MENWGQYRDFSDLEARYTLTKDGAINGTAIEILGAGGPSFTSAGPTHPRSPAPGCLRFGVGGGIGPADAAQVLHSFGGTAVNVIIGFSLFFEGPAENQNVGYDVIVALGENPDMSLAIDFGSSSDITAKRAYLFVRNDKDGTSIWNSETDSDNAGDPLFRALLYNTWYHIEFRVLLDDTVGEIEVRVNGELWNLQTGIDTIPAGSSDTTITEFWFGTDVDEPQSPPGHGAIYRITDGYVVSVDGGGNETDFLYPWMVDTLYPDTDTVEADWTPQGAGDNVVEVDDSPQHDFSTTYNESNTNTDKDRFLTGLSVPESAFGRVMGVQVIAMAQDALDTAIKTARVVIFEGATEGLGTTRTLTESNFQALWHLFEDNPDTSAAWLMADVEAAEIGYELVS